MPSTSDNLLDFAPPRPSPSSLLLSPKAGEVLGLTPSNWGHGADEVPSTYSSSCPAFISAAPMWVAVWGRYDRSAERKLRWLYTAGTSLHFFWPSLSLDWTSTRTEDSDSFNDLRLQKLARVSFVSFVGRRPALQQGSWLVGFTRVSSVTDFVWRGLRLL